MILKSIKLENFRNYKSLSMDFPRKAIILIGDNTQGKTNFLEAVRFLSLFKSFRNSTALDLIKWGESYIRVEGKFTGKKFEDSILGVLSKEEGVPRAKRVVKQNGVIKKVRDVVGSFNTVLFSPDDIRLVTTSPAVRRKYIDIVIGQIDRFYYDNLLSFIKILDNRNKLLKSISRGISNVGELDFWDEELILKGNEITSARKKMFEFANTLSSGFYSEISGKSHKFKLMYLPSFKSNFSYSDIRKNRISEIERETTFKGPHRDDFNFLLDENDLSKYGSRGEQRTAMLALKLSELAFIEEKTKERPVLLLDDVFSELDSKRKKYLIKTLENYQVFITATDLDSIDDEYVRNANVLNVKNGKICL